MRSFIINTELLHSNMGTELLHSNMGRKNSTTHIEPDRGSETNTMRVKRIQTHLARIGNSIVRLLIERWSIVPVSVPYDLQRPSMHITGKLHHSSKRPG